MEANTIADFSLHCPEMAGFWQALARGSFMVRRCRACGEAHWYPRAICPFCSSGDTVWEDGQGRGEIYSYTIMRRTRVPYAIAYVRLAEGPIMMTSIVDTEFDDIRIGNPVTLAIKRRPDGLHVPSFTQTKSVSAP